MRNLTMFGGFLAWLSGVTWIAFNHKASILLILAMGIAGADFNSEIVVREFEIHKQRKANRAR